MAEALPVFRPASQSATIHISNVKQKAGSEKRKILRKILEDEKNKLKNGIIFCNRKVEVEILTKSYQAELIILLL